MKRNKMLKIVPWYIEHLKETGALNCNELKFIIDRFLEQNPEFRKIEEDFTTIPLSDTNGIEPGMMLKVSRPECDFEYVKVDSVESPYYQHKTFLHKLAFWLTSKVLSYGWPQPKIISGELINVNRLEPHLSPKQEGGKE